MVWFRLVWFVYETLATRSWVLLNLNGVKWSQFWGLVCDDLMEIGQVTGGPNFLELVFHNLVKFGQVAGRN